MAEDCGGCRAEVGINELTRDKLVSVEGLSIGKVGMRETSIGACVEPAIAGQAFVSKLFEFAWV